jgi:hypothetical protein
MSLVELTKLCPPPHSPVDGYDPRKEREVEAKYGVRFPKDYVALCRVYGTGTFASPTGHEITIYNPFREFYDTQVGHGRLVNQSWFGAEEQMAKQLQEDGLSVASLFPLGCDADESYLNWVTVGEPEEWKLQMLNYESGFFEIFGLSLSAFLAGFFSGRLRVRGWEHCLVEGRVETYSFVPASYPA